MNRTPKGPISQRLVAGNPITDQLAENEELTALETELRELEENAMAAQAEAYEKFDIAFKEGLWKSIQDETLSVEERFDALDKRFYASTRKVSQPVEGQTTKRRVYERDAAWDKLSFSKADFEALHFSLGLEVYGKTVDPILSNEYDFKLTDLGVSRSLPRPAVSNPALNQYLKTVMDEFDAKFNARIEEIRQTFSDADKVAELTPEDINAYVAEIVKTSQTNNFQTVGDHLSQLYYKVQFVSDLRERGTRLKGANENVKSRGFSTALNVERLYTAKVAKSRLFPSISSELSDEFFFAATTLDKDTWELALDRTIFEREDFSRLPGRIVRGVQRVDYAQIPANLVRGAKRMFGVK